MNDFVSGVMTAFRASPVEIWMIVLSAVVFVALIAAYTLIRNSVLRRRDAAESAETYRTLAQRYKLGPSEEEIIDRMQAEAHTPVRKYQLLTDEALFNGCSRPLVERREVPPATIASLRVKLGFLAEGSEAAPISTTGLPLGALVQLDHRRGTLAGKVVRIAPAALVVELKGDDEAPPISPGTEVVVAYQSSRGNFSMKTHVARQDGRRLSLAHSERVEKKQLRQHYRKSYDGAVLVGLAGSEKRPAPTKFLDLGGGGASLYNPRGQYHPGDDVELAFAVSSTESLRILSRVVRTSQNGKVLHVDFVRIREGERDRIYRMLFQKRAGQGHA